MKYLSIFLVLAVLACDVRAGEGQLSDSRLDEVGLSGLQVLSDEEGLDIRGKFAAVWGRASSFTFGNSASGGYRARHPQFAIGGVITATGGQVLSEEGGVVGSGFAISGGFAYAGRLSGFTPFRGGPN